MKKNDITHLDIAEYLDSEEMVAEYLKLICAFSNTSGGMLYIGVRNDGEVIGVNNSHKLSEDLPNKILNTMGC